MAAVITKSTETSKVEKTTEKKDYEILYKKLVVEGLQKMVRTVNSVDSYFMPYSTRANYRTAGRIVRGCESELKNMKWFMGPLGLPEGTAEGLAFRVEGFWEWLDEDGDDCVDAHMRMCDTVEYMKNILKKLEVSE